MVEIIVMSEAQRKIVIVICVEELLVSKMKAQISKDDEYRKMILISVVLTLF
jgi:hypothetical protein